VSERGYLVYMILTIELLAYLMSYES